MSEQKITVNRHVFTWPGGSIAHDGPCTWENCWRHLPGGDVSSRERSRQISDALKTDGQGFTIGGEGRR